jgi:hypothetical protein
VLIVREFPEQTPITPDPIARYLDKLRGGFLPGIEINQPGVAAATPGAEWDREPIGQAPEIEDDGWDAPLPKGVLSPTLPPAPPAAIPALGEIKTRYPQVLKDLVLAPAEETIKAGLEQGFGEYRPTVERLVKEVADLEDPLTHPQVIGHGLSSIVLGVQVNGKPVAIRVPRRQNRDASGRPQPWDPGLKALQETNTIKGFLKAPYLPLYEKFLGVSGPQDKFVAIVSERAQGDNLAHISAADMAQMTKEDLDALGDALIKGHKAGIERDRRAANLIYHPSKGFVIVDYKPTPARRPLPLYDEFRAVTHSLSGYSINDDLDGITRTPEYEKKFRNRQQASIPALRAWRKTCQEKFAGEDRTPLIEGVDEEIARLEQEIAAYDAAHPAT